MLQSADPTFWPLNHPPVLCGSHLLSVFGFLLFVVDFFFLLLPPSDGSWTNSGVGCKDVFIKGHTRFLTVLELGG